ncbi:MAG: ATP-dependent Clp protease proteolytic subunit [Verrucomicrobiae bacterium]|nr:ATP-dependent Clp protease proteolytic subunit [Verrucomicrobiae bacterium]
MSKSSPIALAQRENGSRAIFVVGEISHQAFDILIPEITRLRLSGDEPITVFINSLGGDPDAAEAILRLLRSPDQKGVRRLVTTVNVGVAASAAADFFCAGDYAICYADSQVLVHGTRHSHKVITAEKIGEVAALIYSDNEYFAMKLASQMFRRFAAQALLWNAYSADPPATVVPAVAASSDP